jgi:predicted ATP-dependent serine protease
MNDPPTLISILLKLGPLFCKTIQWIWNRIKWHCISETAQKIAFAIHSFSWTNLQQTAPAINHVGLIARPEIDQILNIWKSSDDSILLYGEAGTGKSSIALHLGRTLVNAGIPVLFIRATDLPNDQEPVSVIQNRMALSIPLMDAIAKLSKERSCSVIIDQLDSVSGTERSNFPSCHDRRL